MACALGARPRLVYRIGILPRNSLFGKRLDLISCLVQLGVDIRVESGEAAGADPEELAGGENAREGGGSRDEVLEVVGRSYAGEGWC